MSKCYHPLGVSLLLSILGNTSFSVMSALVSTYMVIEYPHLSFLCVLVFGFSTNH